MTAHEMQRLTEDEVRDRIVGRNPTQRLVLASLDLSGMDLSGLPMAHTDLHYCRILGTRFDGTVLLDANFEESDIRRASFRGTDMNDAVFRNSILADSDLTGVGLRNAMFFNTALERLDLTEADLTRANFVRCSGKSLILERANLEAVQTSPHRQEPGQARFPLPDGPRGVDTARELHAKLEEFGDRMHQMHPVTVHKILRELEETLTEGLREINLERLEWSRSHRESLTTRLMNGERDFQGETLVYADLSGMDLSGCNFSRSNLRGCLLQDTVLRDALLDEANVHEADFSGADCRGASFSRLHGHRASFRGTNLEGADMQEARLHHASFRGALLDGADFVGAEGENVDFRDVVWGDTDWSLVTGFNGMILATPRRADVVAKEPEDIPSP